MCSSRMPELDYERQRGGHDSGMPPQWSDLLADFELAFLDVLCSAAEMEKIRGLDAHGFRDVPGVLKLGYISTLHQEKVMTFS